MLVCYMHDSSHVVAGKQAQQARQAGKPGRSRHHTASAGVLPCLASLPASKEGRLVSSQQAAPVLLTATTQSARAQQEKHSTAQRAGHTEAGAGCWAQPAAPGALPVRRTRGTAPRKGATLYLRPDDLPPDRLRWRRRGLRLRSRLQRVGQMGSDKHVWEVGRVAATSVALRQQSGLRLRSRVHRVGGWAKGQVGCEHGCSAVLCWGSRGAREDMCRQRRHCCCPELYQAAFNPGCHTP